MKLKLVIIFGVCLLPGSGVPAAAKNTHQHRAAEVKAEIQSFNSWIVDACQRLEKYKRMRETPFTFYRATDHLFYHDIGTHRIEVPEEWNVLDSTLSTWISGDFHIQNVGFVDVGNGTLTFDLNDFDESYCAPFYWDLIRCVASVFVITGSDKWKIEGLDEKDANKERLGFEFTTDDAHKAADMFLEKYFETVKEGNPAPISETTMQEKSATGLIVGALKEAKSPDYDKFWSKNTGGMRDGFATTKAKAKLREISPEEKADLEKGWPEYSQRAAKQASLPPPQFQRVDGAVERLGSGLGSLGVRKIYAIVEGPTAEPSDNVLVEAKEARPPSMLGRAIKKSDHGTSSEAARISDAIHEMLPKVNPYEGYFSGSKRSYHVTEISPFSEDFNLNAFKKKEQLDEFLDFAAIALAHAHCHAKRSFGGEVRKFLKDEKKVKKTLLEIGEKYGAQVIKDFDLFKNEVEAELEQGLLCAGDR